MFLTVDETEQARPFGERLSETRMTLGLTLEELSKSLNLNIKILQALEESDIDNLPPAIYVQGYIKAYAKALGVSGEEVHREYMMMVGEEAEVELNPRSPLPSETTSDSPAVKSLTISVIIVIIAAVIFGIYNYYADKVISIDSKESKVDASVNEKLEIPDLSSTTLVEPTPVKDKSAQNVTDSGPAVTSTKKEDITLAKEAEQTIDDDTSPENVVATEEGVSTSEPDLTVSDQDGELPDVLMLRATSESWAEIRDRNNKRIYFALLKPDEFVELKGEAPFDVFLGNALNVNLAVNDLDVDMSDFIRPNNVAHFKVSEDSDQIIFH